MLFSVIISVYNSEKYLNECVNSVLQQKFQDYEVLLINDGSPDNSEQICIEYQDKYTNIHLINKENGGVSDARNCGIKNAKGEYCIFIDADDMLAEGALESFSEIIENDCNPDLILGRSYSFKDGTTEMKENAYWVEQSVVRGQNGRDAFASIIEKYGWATMGVKGAYRRQFLLDNQLFFRTNTYYEDVDWVFRGFLKAQNVSANDRGTYCWRNRTNSVSKTVSVKNAEDIVALCNEWMLLVNEGTNEERLNEAIKINTGKRFYNMVHKYAKHVSVEEVPRLIILINNNRDLFLLKYGKRNRKTYMMYKILGVSNLVRLLRYKK